VHSSTTIFFLPASFIWSVINSKKNPVLKKISTDSPVSNCCSHGTLTLLRSSKCILIWIFATTTKICTKACSGCPRGRKPSKHRPCALLLERTSRWTTTKRVVQFCSLGWVWVACLSAIHFQGRSIRQVSCYTLLSGFRLPWPPSCCQNGPTPFLVSGISTHSGTLAQLSVHPASPVLLTKNGPLTTESFTTTFYF